MNHSWKITRRGRSLNIDLAANADLSSGETQAVAEALEGKMDEGINSVVLAGAKTRSAMGSRDLFAVVKRLGAIVTRAGKAFTVRTM